MHDDPLVLLPLPLQEDALSEHPRPAYEGHHLQTRLAVDLCTLAVNPQYQHSVCVCVCVCVRACVRVCVFVYCVCIVCV